VQLLLPYGSKYAQTCTFGVLHLVCNMKTRSHASALYNFGVMNMSTVLDASHGAEDLRKICTKKDNH